LPSLSEAVMTVEEEKSELDKIFEQIFDPKNIAFNTELTRNEITAFSTLYTIAKRHNLPVLDEFLLQNLQLRVSKGRAGKKELVKIVAGRRQEQEEEAVGGWRGIFARRANNEKAR
jgi:hypothetical protein